MTAIKICGLCTVDHALTAVQAGADMIGVVFAASRRQVTPEQAATIITAVRQHPSGQHVRVVGLFVNEHPQTVNAIAKSCGLDYVQLSGDEKPQHVADLCRPVIKSVRLDKTKEEQGWFAALHDPRTSISFAPCPLIVDAHVPGAYGGTGVLADWQQAATLTDSFMLAGGLTTENVADAIVHVRPWGVDVSSGVERDGQKDPIRIESFIRAVRSLEEEYPYILARVMKEV